MKSKTKILTHPSWNTCPKILMLLLLLLVCSLVCTCKQGKLLKIWTTQKKKKKLDLNPSKINTSTV